MVLRMMMMRRVRVMKRMKIVMIFTKAQQNQQPGCDCGEAKSRQFHPCRCPCSSPPCFPCSCLPPVVKIVLEFDINRSVPSAYLVVMFKQADVLCVAEVERIQELPKVWGFVLDGLPGDLVNLIFKVTLKVIFKLKLKVNF